MKEKIIKLALEIIKNDFSLMVSYTWFTNDIYTDTLHWSELFVKNELLNTIRQVLPIKENEHLQFLTDKEAQELIKILSDYNKKEIDI